MKQTNKKKSKLIKFLNGKAFYVVMCICFVVVGIAAWSGVQVLRSNVENGSDNTGTTQSATSDTAQNGSSEPLFSFPEGTLPELNSSKNDGAFMSEPNDTDTALKDNDPESAETDTDKSEQTAAPVASFFINPVLGEVVKDFSDTELQYSITMRDMRLHAGIDIAADEGTPVIAAGEGVIVNVFEDMLLGWVVEVDHGNEITAKYCGLSAQPDVKTGDAVNSSTRLGNVGTVPFESVEQSHLHLEFFMDGKPVPPTEFIGQ